MAILLFLVGSLHLSTAFSMPDMDMNEIMRSFATLEDDISITLTNENFESTLLNSTGPWFIFFSEPRSRDSILKNPVWYIFGSNAKEANLTLNLGKVDMSTQENVRTRFKVYYFPMFVYVEDGYAYQYKGPSEVEDLEAVVKEKLYLQYDRFPLYLDGKQDSYQVFRRFYLDYTKELVGGLFIITYIGLTICSWLRSKKEAPKEKKD
jgi:hypothetical protein